jgi:phosphoribosyl-AMP cyclohydrolase
MSRKIGMVITVAFLCLVALPRHATAQDEAYTASARITKDTGGGLVQFNFTITKWATQEEIKRLGAILKDQGQEALLAELKKLDAGRIRRTNDTGVAIAVAEKSQHEGKTVITLIAARQMSLSETKRGRLTSTDYPFGFMQVQLDDKGEGSGKMVTAAKIKYDKDGDTFRLDPFGNGATPINNVRPLK